MYDLAGMIAEDRNSVDAPNLVAIDMRLSVRDLLCPWSQWPDEDKIDAELEKIIASRRARYDVTAGKAAQCSHGPDIGKKTESEKPDRSKTSSKANVDSGSGDAALTAALDKLNISGPSTTTGESSAKASQRRSATRSATRSAVESVAQGASDRAEYRKRSRWFRKRLSRTMNRIGKTRKMGVDSCLKRVSICDYVQDTCFRYADDKCSLWLGCSCLGETRT